MKATWLALAALLAAAPVRAQARYERDFGAGAVIGYPVGASAKLWLDPAQALDFGVGYSGNAAFWADWLWHFEGLIAQPADATVLPYAGAGPRLEVGDPQFGIRTVMGLSYRPKSRPIEVFVEAGPVFRLTQGGHVDADGGAGVRYYFADAGRR